MVELVRNPHLALPTPPEMIPGSLAVISGDYLYYHFCCDDTDDKGWGCGYRSLQIISSWVRAKMLDCGEEPRAVPSIGDIQKGLVMMQDKPIGFDGSREWIGTVEVALIIDYFYNVACPILHVHNGEALQDHKHKLFRHFRMTGSPVMVGGSTDTAAKILLGICESEETVFFLVLDPHYIGDTPTTDDLASQHLLEWRPLSGFLVDSFYNLCMPRLPSCTNMASSSTLSYQEECTGKESVNTW